MSVDSGAVLAFTAALLAAAAAIAIARARSLLAIALMLALFAASLSAAFAALDAPDLALVEALGGAALAPLCWIGAVTLTTPSAKSGARTPRTGPLAAAIALAALLGWTMWDLPPFGAANAAGGGIYVSRAAGETGVRNAAAGVAGNYRTLDTLAQLGALAGGALGLYALLAFGERGARQRRGARDGGA